MLSAGVGAGNNRPGLLEAWDNILLPPLSKTFDIIEYFYSVCKSSKKPSFSATSTGGRGGGNPKPVLKRFQTKESLEVENINDNGKRDQR